MLASIPLGVGIYLEHRLSSNVSRIPGVFDGLEDRPARPSAPQRERSTSWSSAPTVGRTSRRRARRARRVLDPGAQRSDTLMILHIAADRRSASIISIPRDTWVNVPGHGMNKINAAFSLSGPSLAIATVEDLTGVRIDHLAVIDWSAFEALIDAVGGIDVTRPRRPSPTRRATCGGRPGRTISTARRRSTTSGSATACRTATWTGSPASRWCCGP